MRPVNELSRRFEQFMEEEWDIDEAYSMADFGELFHIDIRLARYYLVKYVDLGQLFCLKWNYDVYYLKSCWLGPFERFSHLGNVKIKRGFKVCRSTRRY